MSKRVKFWARLLLGVLVTFVVIGGIFLMANNAPEDKVKGVMIPITTPQGPRTAEAEMVTLVITYLSTPAPNPAPSPETTPTKL